MGYHKNKIEKGTLGEFSKIKEEFLEAEDAYEQGNNIMLLLELSDMLGAIEDFLKKYNMNLDDLTKMKNATQSAFNDGSRK
jgi:phosphoribosyl-ATP pyrophosphohydrolase